MGCRGTYGSLVAPVFVVDLKGGARVSFHWKGGAQGGDLSEGARDLSEERNGVRPRAHAAARKADFPADDRHPLERSPSDHGLSQGRDRASGVWTKGPSDRVQAGRV